MSFGGLYISISGIYANKKALDTISHNIANVNNPNYVRQSALHASNTYNQSPTGNYQLGTGVKVSEIRQIRDEFLDINYRREAEFYGYWKAIDEIYNEIEMIFHESKSTGIQNVLEDFWNNWNELAKEADSLAVRGLIYESSVAFTETINHTYTQLDNLQFNLNKEIINRVNRINNLLEEMRIFNDKVKMAEAIGQHSKANDFRDSRNTILDELSQLLPITYYEKSDSEIVISLYGKELINGDYINPIEIQYDGKGFGHIHWSDTGEKIDLKNRGELGGYINARDEGVTEYKDRLDYLIQTLAKEVNNLHREGINLKGETGISFFIPEKEEDLNAANVKINPYLIDFDNIAVSKSEAVGDGEIAKEIGQLREKLLFIEYGDESGEKTLNADRYYRDLVISIGVERNRARKIASNQGTLLKQINDRRKAISNVSLDEEMAAMLQYQHSYIANSRVVNAIDEMIETIINKTGIVGR